MHLRATTIEDLLSQCTPRTQALIESARRRIRTVIPHATEKLRGGWGLIGYNAPAYFAFIAPGLDEIRIGFEWGVLLNNDANKLNGNGSQVRYFTIQTERDLKSPVLAMLLQEAAELVPPARKASKR